MHVGCWATIKPPHSGGVREQTTRERWNKIHGLRGQGVGPLDCARRPSLALNAVKRDARTPEPRALRNAPAYRPTPAAPCRDHLRERRKADPAAPVTHLLQEIGELGYSDSANLAAPLPQPGPRRGRYDRDEGCQGWRGLVGVL